MSKTNKPKTWYAVYNQDDECVFIGMGKDCIAFTGMTERGFYCHVSRTSKGTVKKGNKYSVFKIEEDD